MTFSTNDSDPMIQLYPHTAWCGRSFATGSEMMSHQDECPACEAIGMEMCDDGSAPPECCPHCGKDYYDFSDMGCGYCDRRSPEWGTNA